MKCFQILLKIKKCAVHFLKRFTKYNFETIRYKILFLGELDERGYRYDRLHDLKIVFMCTSLMKCKHGAVNKMENDVKPCALVMCLHFNLTKSCVYSHSILFISFEGMIPA